MIDTIFIETSNKTNRENFVCFECSICLTVMRDGNDSMFIDKYGCCALCVDELVWPNKPRWDRGWRPGKRKKAQMRKKRLELPSYYVI